MTLWVTRADQAVTIHGNTGVSVRVDDSRLQEFSVTEHAAHLRHFWGQLGNVLDQAEEQAREEAEDARQ